MKETHPAERPQNQLWDEAANNYINLLNKRKMKHKYFKISNLFFVSIILTSIFISCEKEHSEVSSENEIGSVSISEYVTLQDNDELLTILTQLDEGKEAKEISQIANLYSMWDAFDAITESDELTQKQMINKYPKVFSYNSEGELALNVKDPMLAKILNTDGYVKIGKNIIKVEGDVIKALTNGDLELLSELETATESNVEGTILVEKVEDFTKSDLKSTMDYTWSGTVYSGSTKRVQWDKWGRHYPLLGYASLGAEIKYQEKKLLGWFAQKRSLYLHVVCDYIEYGCQDGWCYFDENINMSESETTKSLTVSKHYSQGGTVTTISGLVIDFNANGIIATR